MQDASEQLADVLCPTCPSARRSFRVRAVVSQGMQFLRESVQFLGEFVGGFVVGWRLLSRGGSRVDSGLVDDAGSDVGHRPGRRRV